MRTVDRLSRLVGATVVAMSTAAAMLVATGAPAAASEPEGPPALSGGVNGQVYATLVVGNTVYVGGSFTLAQAQGQRAVDRTNLAAFNLTTGALVQGWQADVDGMVRSLASSGNYLYVGGDYRTIGGVSQGRLARVSLSTGAVDTGFDPKVNGEVRGLATADGSVYAGGQFSKIDGVAQRGLTKLDATSGARVAAFDGSTNALVNALTLSPDGTRLAVGGRFTQLSGANREGLGLVSPTTGSVVGPSFAGSVNPMISLSWLSDGTALFGGSANTNNMAARWNANTGSLTWHFRLGGDVQAVDYYDGSLYLGFHDNYQGDRQTHLIRIDPTTRAVSSFRPVFNQFWGVRTISAGPWGLVIGGQFSAISGVWAHNVAIWREAAAATAPRIEVSAPAKAPYGSKVEVGVTVPGGTGTVTLTGAGPAVAKSLTRGTATFDVPQSLGAGAHALTVDYSGDTAYLPGTTTHQLTVTKAGTTVRATVARKATNRRPGKVKVAVTSEVTGGQAPSGTVRLKLTHGAKHRTVKQTLQGKTVKITLPRLRAGSWKLVAKYTGDTDHKASTQTRKLKVTRVR